MTLEILYLTHQRAEFRRASLAALSNGTNWDLVSAIRLYSDNEPDNHRRIAVELTHSATVPIYRRSGDYGGPVAIMNDYLSKTEADLFAKIDNDVIVPPGWLDACLAVMDQHPALDLLGIEPPASRTPAPGRSAETAPEVSACNACSGYAPCPAIGGIGLMRTRAFRDRAPMRPHGPNGVGGFTDWQLANPDVRKGWIVPPLDLFLLDRLPIEPYASLSREYIANGWQRPWTNYRPEDSALWAWWLKERAA